MAKSRFLHSSGDIWRYKRQTLETDNGWPTCPYCETPFYYADGELDHINPISFGGSHRKRNLVLVCGQCNKERSNLPLPLWLKNKGYGPDSVRRRLIELGKDIPIDL